MLCLCVSLSLSLFLSLSLSRLRPTQDPSLYQDFSQVTALVTKKARQISANDVTLVSCIGSGEFGEVYHAAIQFDASTVSWWCDGK